MSRIPVIILSLHSTPNVPLLRMAKSPSRTEEISRKPSIQRTRTRPSFHAFLSVVRRLLRRVHSQSPQEDRAAARNRPPPVIVGGVHIPPREITRPMKKIAIV